MTSELVLNDRYLLLEKIGAGGMGSVWLAEDQLLKRRVALKELLHRYEADLDASRSRALREAQAMARMNHPSIVRIHDVFLVRKDPWIVMEYIEGRSLGQIISERALAERAIAQIALPVLHGLRAVHGVGMVHRDVKPGNILVAKDESVFLVDFGIAKMDADTQITGYSKVLGTTEFMAPERIKGGRGGPSSDLWSLGVTLFYSLEGYSPFLRDNYEATRTAILHAPPPTPRRHGDLAGIVLQLLRKVPSERATAADVADVLQAVCERRPTARQPRRIIADAAPATTTARAQTVLAGPQLLGEQEVVRKASPNTGVAMLLAMSEENAAKVLAGLRAREAGALMQAIAVSKPHAAGAILRILSSTGAGHAMDYVNPSAAASVLASMSAREGALILGRTDPRAAAEIVMALPAETSALLMSAMQGRQSVTVLSYVRPASVAAVFRESGDLKDKLLGQLSPAFQAQVRHHL